MAWTLDMVDTDRHDVIVGVRVGHQDPIGEGVKSVHVVAVDTGDQPVTLSRDLAEVVRNVVLGDSTEHLQELMDALDAQLGAR